MRLLFLTIVLSLSVFGRVCAEEAPAPAVPGPFEDAAPPNPSPVPESEIPHPGLTADGLPLAEVIELPDPPAPKHAPAPKQDAPKADAPKADAPKATDATLPNTPASSAPNSAANAPAPKPYVLPKVANFALAVSGELTEDLTIGPEQSPLLIKGAFVVPAGKTLFIKPGVNVQFQPDAEGAQAGDPSRAGSLWVYGRLLADGLSGSAVAFSGTPKSRAAFYFYGKERSELRGVHLTDLSIAQSGGSVTWLGCEVKGASYYALSGGAALLMQCTFKNSGGVLATYEEARWALLVRGCRFDGGREGLAFGENSRDMLSIDKNSFVNLQTTALRAWPGSGKRAARTDLLVGENYYGTNVPEEADARIADVRSDAKLRLRINTRPPAEQDYASAGAKASVETLARVLKETETQRTRMIEAIEKAGVGKTLALDSSASTSH